MTSSLYNFLKFFGILQSLSDYSAMGWQLAPFFMLRFEVEVGLIVLLDEFPTLFIGIGLDFGLVGET